MQNTNRYYVNLMSTFERGAHDDKQVSLVLVLRHAPVEGLRQRLSEEDDVRLHDGVRLQGDQAKHHHHEKNGKVGKMYICCGRVTGHYS